MKTLEEIKKEFEERLNNICVHGFKYKDCTRGCFPRLIESTILQTKQELIEEIRLKVNEVTPDVNGFGQGDDFIDGKFLFGQEIMDFLQKLSNK